MKPRGFSVIELLIVLAIMGGLLGLALTSYTNTIASTRTRATAESMLAGLQMARSEAIRRNTPMRFQIVSGLTSTCAYASNTAIWIVTQTDQVAKGDVATLCHAEPWNPPDQPDPCTPAPTNRAASTPTITCANDPWVAFRSDGSRYAADVTVAAQKSLADTGAASIITFGPIGQVLTNIGGAVTNPSLGFIRITSTNVTDAKSWGILINTTNGNLRMCEPSVAAGMPMACS